MKFTSIELTVLRIDIFFVGTVFDEILKRLKKSSLVRFNQTDWPNRYRYILNELKRGFKRGK